MELLPCKLPFSWRRADPHMCYFLETCYLDEEVKPIKTLGDRVTNLKCVRTQDEGRSEYLFDCLTLSESSD
ncbi:hypothetical protein JRQ81_012563 [Phrynocephalus forsythii]|uniref:Uncharacterized protein n=1 Tax=Phrynocephalus forsythii TaxID=171643 RepID=A0A9Q1B5W0_9SAUR|nr:hypothetical protein JRQ81_012563 [Phrynocephalus forsythii]